jgi:hypothetical protein
MGRKERGEGDSLYSIHFKTCESTIVLYILYAPKNAICTSKNEGGSEGIK